MVNFEKRFSDFSQTNENDASTSLPLKTKKRKRRHIPHSQRPTQFVEKRNSRERRRVRAVNEAFEILRYHLPCQGDISRLSKVEILTGATQYIQDLGDMLQDYNRNGTTTRREERTGGLSVHNAANKVVNHVDHRHFHKVPRISEDRTACNLLSRTTTDNNIQIKHSTSNHTCSKAMERVMETDRNVNFRPCDNDTWPENSSLYLDNVTSASSPSSWYHMLTDIQVLPWDSELEQLIIS